MEPLSFTSAAWVVGAIGLAALGARAARGRPLRQGRGSASAGAIVAAVPAVASPAPASGAACGQAVDPGASARRLELRMEALEAAQVALAARLEAGGGAEAERLQAMAGQILGLVRDKGASLETALAGLDQLRARLRVLEQMGAPAEARQLLEGLEGRLEASERARGVLEARLASLEATPSPLAELSERLAALHAQKDMAVEAALGRLAPLEAKLAEVEASLAARDPRGALERFGERLEAARAAQEAVASTLGERLSALEDAPVPLAELSERLAALHAQKDMAVEAALGRLAPLEAKLAEVEASLAARDPRGALERFGERLEAAQAAFGERLEAARAAQEAVASTLGERLSALEDAPVPLAELSERLAALHAQKDMAVEAALGRLAPLEAKLAEVEASLAARDPRGALERFSERLEAARAAQEASSSALDERLSALEDAPVPLAELSERLAALHAQKDMAVEAALGRLAPLEAKLAEVEASLAARDPRGALERFGERLEALQGRVDGIAAEGADAEAEAARAEAQAIAAQLVAARTVAAETRLFADRIALLEASLPRLSLAQALMMQALESRAAPPEGWSAPGEGPAEGAAGTAPRPADPVPFASDADEEPWRMPRVVSVHTG